MTEAAAGKPMKVTITNVYVPDTEVTFEAVKVFENGELNAGNIFTFDVSEETGTFISGKDQVHVSEAVTKDGTSDKKGSKGKITFQPIKYTLDDLKKKDGSYEDKKVFRYVIQERVPASADGNGYDSASQIKYDLTKKYAVVTLQLNGDKLEASVRYTDRDIPVFTNTKNPPPETTKGTKTGDDSGIILYSALLILSLSLIAVILGIRRKHKTEE